MLLSFVCLLLEHLVCWLYSSLVVMSRQLDAMKRSHCNTTLVPYELTWVIDKLSTHFDKDLEGPPILCSNELTISSIDVKDLRLFIRLKTRSSDDPEFVSLFLINTRTDQPEGRETIVFKLSIIDRDGVKRHSRASVKEFGQPQAFGGWNNFITQDTLLDPANGLLKDGKLTVLCEVNLLDCLDATNPTSSSDEEDQLDCKFVEWKSALFESGKFTDVVLAFEDGRELRAHKLILATVSPVFEAMFSAEWLENSSNRVAITDSSLELFKRMLQYIYTGKLELSDQCVELLILADKFQIGSLKSRCEQSLCANISLDNATELLTLANTYDASKLKAALMDSVQSQIERSVGAIRNNPEKAIEAGKFLFALTGGKK